MNTGFFYFVNNFILYATYEMNILKSQPELSGTEYKLDSFKNLYEFPFKDCVTKSVSKSLNNTRMQ